MGTLSCHSNQNSYPTGIKNITVFVPVTYKCYVCNMERISLTVSEMSFENVDGWTTDGRAPDACLYYKLTYEPSAQVS